jgi:hypothetical protein
MCVFVADSNQERFHAVRLISPDKADERHDRQGYCKNLSQYRAKEYTQIFTSRKYPKWMITGNYPLRVFEPLMVMNNR